jgi:hypothetical protein
MDVSTMALENYAQVIHKEHKASALLLNNPTVINGGRVIAHPVNHVQNKVVKLNPKKQLIISTQAEIQKFLSLQKMQQMIERFITEKQISFKQLA